MSDKFIDDLGEDDSLTTWHNPTDQTVVLRIYKGFEGTNLKDHVKGGPTNPWLTAVFQPGQKRKLPKQYDAAVHTMGPDGVTIMGGGAPQLRRVGGEEILHPALDVELQAKKEALKAEANLLQETIRTTEAFAALEKQHAAARKALDEKARKEDVAKDTSKK